MIVSDHPICAADYSSVVESTPVAEALGVPLEADGHTAIVEGLVSRKKQLVPLLPRIQAALSGNAGVILRILQGYGQKRFWPK